MTGRPACVQEVHSGCCCAACLQAPRLLRPSSAGSYGRWFEEATGGLLQQQDLGTCSGPASTRAQVCWVYCTASACRQSKLY